ncbi:MAG: 3-octaprenyl-4-hydroxybenzoate carboxy-lyase [Sulfurovum sp. AS07-7]|nr:MAG: 3-octaprenyl-4-hydroxybenzoate carboxy-lyase [Sulfurovum sp. AS07-7]
MRDVIEWYRENGGIKVIDNELDVELEIPHIAYLETKKENSKPLLFTNPISKRVGIKYDMPVFMNLFANKDLTKEIFGNHPDIIAKDIEWLLKMKPPKGIIEKIKMLPKLWKLKSVFPKRTKTKGECQEIVLKGNDIDLDKLPILKTWELDGGRFITMGQTYTKSLDGNIQNLGMYRLQQYDKKSLGMHWQIHKDGAHFFNDYAKAGKKMPVSIAIGGDPLYIWCGQAPMPHGMFELMLYGLIRGENAKLVKSITNDIYVPRDVDIVIEGFVDPSIRKVEGPFGDHTGYYTLPEEFPVVEVTAITMKKKAVFHATVVGKPPLEDKYMGWGTERIFLPLLKPMAPDLIDYHMPENGVFHNLIISKMKTLYKGHAMQFMHAFWGVGQMSFVKHAIFVDENAPDLNSYKEITKYILDRVDKKKIFISKGIVDHLDHSSNEQFVGGKLGIDATGEKVEKKIDILSDEDLLEKAKVLDSQIVDLKQFYTDSANPICVISVNKKDSMKKLFDKLEPLSKHIAILVVIDHKNNDLKYPYMLVWRVVNNIDAGRDIVLDPFITIDATNKSEVDGFYRKWPDDTLCTKEVLEKLKVDGLVEYDDKLIRKFGLLEFN